MTAEEFLNKKYNGKGYSAKVHDWNKSTHHNIVLPNLLEEFASLKTKELEEENKRLKELITDIIPILDYAKTVAKTKNLPIIINGLLNRVNQH